LNGQAPGPALRLTSLRIGVLHNPRSGANLASVKSMHRLFGAHPGITYRDATDPASVAHALHEMAEHGVDTVAISGGDGTVNAVLNTVFRSPFPQCRARTAGRH
jgi:diacylglycerol kinase family enzyme